MPGDPQTTELTPEEIAFRRGKSAGYSEGVINGWDEAMRHVQAVIDNATKEPDAVARHRKVVQERRAGQEVASNEQQV